MASIDMSTYHCYYCNFECNTEAEYLKHGALTHLYKPLFPNQTELRTLGLKPQRKPWEEPIRTEQEAIDHLADWAYKRMQEEQQERINAGKDAYKRIPMKVLGEGPNFQRRLFTQQEIDTMDFSI